MKSSTQHEDPFGLHIVQRKESGGGGGGSGGGGAAGGGGGGGDVEYATCSRGVKLDPGAGGGGGAAGTAGGGDAGGRTPVGSPGGSGLAALDTAVAAAGAQEGADGDEDGGDIGDDSAVESEGDGETAAPATDGPAPTGVQRRGGGGMSDGDVQRVAAEGVGSGGGALPHLGQIQASFGADHDLSGVSAHVGGSAAEAATAIGAEAYTTGSSIAFGKQPDLHLAAHEAAHVVQQRQGVSLSGGVGQAGDAYERHADAVADRVVAGQSATDLLGGSSNAPATQMRAAPVQLRGKHKTKRQIAKSLIKIAGTAKKSDGKLVVKQLMKFTRASLKALSTQGTKVVVCRGSVTEYLTDLAGVQPRGWPPGMTWDTVPGLNDAGANEVVIAVIGHGTKKGAHVAKTGEGHGSHNLVLHETGHAHDLNQGAGKTRRSASADFLAARTADLATLSAYETQAGDAGEEETYAESLARFYGKDPKDAKDHPNLHKYWKEHPIGK